MIDAIRNNHEKTAEYVKKVYNMPDTVSSDMKRLFAIVEGLVSDNLEFQNLKKMHIKKSMSLYLEIVAYSPVWGFFALKNFRGMNF